MKKKEIKEKLNMAFKEETPNLSESIIKACESEEQFAPEIELKPSVKRFNFRRFASVFACLSSNIVTLIVCLLVSVAWAVIYNFVGTLILNKCDVY